MISIYSIISSVLWLSVALAIILLVSRQKAFLASYGVNALTLTALLALLRVLLPLDLRDAYVISSYRILPWVAAILQTPIVGVLTLGQVVCILWFSGIVIFLVRQSLSLYLGRMQCKRYHLISVSQVQRVACELAIPANQVRVAKEVPVPMVAGFFRPVIYLPLLDISDSELAWILRHELQHIRNRDNLLKLFYMLLGAVLWWNPLIHQFRCKLDDILEFRCDQALLDKADDAQRVNYTEALLHVAQQMAEPMKQKRHPANITAFIMPKKEDALLTRAHLALFSKPRRIVTQVLSTLLCVAIFVCSYFVLLQPAYEAPVEEGEIVVAINRDNAYLVERADGSYELWFCGVHVGSYSHSEIRSEPLCELEIRNND